MAKIRVVKIELSNVKTFSSFVELIGNERAAIATLSHYLTSDINQVDSVSVLLDDGSWYKLHSIGSGNLTNDGGKFYIKETAKVILDLCAYYSGAYDTTSQTSRA